MSLNIKNEEVCALVKRAAELTGSSQTSVVERGLRLLLAELEADSRAARVQLAVERFQQTLLPGARERIWQDFDDLYDENGLPR